MNKKKQIALKIISGIIVFTFIMSFSQFVLMTTKQANAASEIDWENPNKDSKNTYKFKVSDVLNADLAMKVVGCTGVVNKVSEWMTKIITLDAKKLIAEKLKETDLVKKACRQTEKGATATAATAINLSLTDVVPILIDCQEYNTVKTPELQKAMIDAAKEQAKKDNLEQCFNGIAITLAKNQLTALTRNAVSWINSGFGGNPLYVQNITSLTNSIEKNIIETGTSRLLDQDSAFPYGSGFANSLINYHKSRSGGLLIGAGNTLDSLTSDLGNFISDPRSYYENQSDKTALQRAKESNDIFSNDFSAGGWEGYLALTQRDQNNPLGFAMSAAQRLADKIEEESQNTKNEVSQNNGFLSQKKCVKWQLYTDESNPQVRYTGTGVLKQREFVYSENKSGSDPNFDKCVEFEVTTPGTLIKDKISGYLGSPERQLELADTINKSLNAVFTVLISKLENNGLKGLSSEKYTYDDENANWVDTTNSDSSYAYSNNGAYSSGFDLTRDLGNTYIHDKVYSAGTWNAQTGITDTKQTLSVGYNPPYYYNGTPIPENTANTYYTTTTAGNKTKLINEGYNGWAIGDRAFWNGSTWQNWKKDQTSPIKKRGVIQIQKDYIVAVKEMLQVTPSVMPKFGELDYCIPGPNPSYKTNSGDIQNAYGDWVNTLVTDFSKKSWFLGHDKNTYHIDGPGTDIYETWKGMYSDTPSLWYYLAQKPASGDCGWTNCNSGINNVAYAKYLGDGTEENVGGSRPDWIDKFLHSINSLLFNDFYKGFDEQMNRMYYKNMTSMFLENEKTAVLEKNPAYVKMAEEGLNLTRNIVSYSEDLTATEDQYKKDLGIVTTNIGKLEAIRAEVGKIVKDAQDRRDKKLFETLVAETTKKCKAEGEACMRRVGVPAEVSQDDLGEYCIAKDIACMKDVMTEAEYKDFYQGCFDEENILYYDASQIMSGGNTEERCTNGIDDDLDGLIDKKDPDCKGYVDPGPGGGSGGGVGNSNGACSTGKKVGNNPEHIQSTSLCEDRETDSDCDYYYHLNGAYACVWTPTGGGGATPSQCQIDPDKLVKDYTASPNTACLSRDDETTCTNDDYYSGTKRYVCKWNNLIE